MRGSKLEKDTALNGLMEEFNSVSVSPSPQHQADPCPDPSVEEENGVQAPPTSFLSQEAGGVEGEIEGGAGGGPSMGGRSLSVRENGYAARNPFYPDAMPGKPCLVTVQHDYRAILSALLTPDARWRHRASTGGSFRDYEYWRGGAPPEHHKKRPNSSYFTEGSPQPTARQRSQSGSGLQEMDTPCGVSTYRSRLEAWPYCPHTHPSCSETITTPYRMLMVIASLGGVPKLSVIVTYLISCDWCLLFIWIPISCC